MSHVKLGDVATSKKGKKPTSLTQVQTNTHSIPYVDIKAFEKGVIDNFSDGQNTVICDDGDLMIVWDGSRSGLVGRSMKGAIGSTLAKITSDKLDTDYLYYFLQGKYHDLNTRQRGTGTPHVDPNVLWNFEIFAPDKDRQSEIVAKIEELFSEIDESMRNFQHTLRLLRSYKEAYLYKQYSTFNETVKVGSVVDMISGHAFKKAEYSASGVRLFQIANVSFGKTKWDAIEHLPAEYIETYPQLSLKAGDIVMALNRPLLDDTLKVAELSSADVPAILYQRVGKFIFDSSVINPRFLLYFFRSPVFVHWLKEQLQGVNIPFINKSKLMGCDLLPLPELSIQIDLVGKIDAEISRIDALEDDIKLAIQRAITTKQSILSKAFKGELA